MISQVEKLKISKLLSRYYQWEKVPADMKQKISAELLKGKTALIFDLSPCTNTGIKTKIEITRLLLEGGKNNE